MLHCSAQMCCHRYSDRHTADKQASVITARKDGKILTPMSTLESSASPAGLSWSRCTCSLYCVHDIFTSSVCPHPHALTKSQRQALVLRTRLRASHRGPSALSRSTSTRTVRCDHSTACGGQGGWATILFPSPVVHAAALNRSTRPSSTKEAALRQQSPVRGVYMQHFLSAAVLLTITQVDGFFSSQLHCSINCDLFFHKINHKCLKRTSLQRETKGKTWWHFINVF